VCCFLSEVLCVGVSLVVASKPGLRAWLSMKQGAIHTDSSSHPQLFVTFD